MFSQAGFRLTGKKEVLISGSSVHKTEHNRRILYKEKYSMLSENIFQALLVAAEKKISADI
jgi:hypothetical protein